METQSCRYQIIWCQAHGLLFALTPLKEITRHDPLLFLPLFAPFVLAVDGHVEHESNTREVIYLFSHLSTRFPSSMITIYYTCPTKTLITNTSWNHHVLHLASNSNRWLETRWLFVLFLFLDYTEVALYPDVRVLLPRLHTESRVCYYLDCPNLCDLCFYCGWGRCCISSHHAQR
jgi:hypothetical protein